MLGELSMLKTFCWKDSALFGMASFAGSALAFLENQSVLFVGGIALGVMGVGFAIYRFPNEQALKENKRLHVRIEELETRIIALMVKVEQATVHSASLEQQIKDSLMRFQTAKTELEKNP